MFGYNHALSPSLAVGLAMYGNGGMNTDYSSNPYARFGATGPACINLEQLFITPAVAWRFAKGQSVGLALNLAYQTFEANGISIFNGFSADLAHGTDSATGAGLRLGWQGRFGEHVTRWVPAGSRKP